MKSFSALIIIQLNYNPYSAYWVCIYFKKFIISDKMLLDALLGILGAMWDLINRMPFISCALPNSEITYDWIHTVHALKCIVCELMITVPFTVSPCDFYIIHNAFVVIWSSHTCFSCLCHLVLTHKWWMVMLVGYSHSSTTPLIHTCWYQEDGMIQYRYA